MNAKILCLWLALLATGSAVAEPLRPAIERCEVKTPAGDYALVRLEFDLPEAADGYQRWTYIGGLRDGVMPMDDGIGLRGDDGQLRLEGGRLSGTFIRNNSLSTSSTFQKTVPPAEVSVDAKVMGNAISGTAKIGAAVGKVSGTLTPEAEFASRNAVPSDHAWPAFLGPVGAGHAPLATGVATIDTPEDISLVWRCEEIDIGQGIGAITRFMHTWKSASGRRTGSGSASPVAADGRIFLSYYVPAPRAEDEEERKSLTYFTTEKELSQAMLAEARTAGYEGDKLPEYAGEKVYQSTDDVVLCLDAATGKTLWKAVIRGRGTNLQHHKVGPFNMSPAIGDGKLFALGTSGWLYAFDAATGTPLWEAPSVFDYNAALLVCGDVLIAPAGKNWGGYDTKTGKLLWTAEPRGVVSLNRWAHAGRELLVGRMGPQHAPTGIACLDPKTGEELWRLKVNVLTSGRGLGPGGISIVGDRMLVYQDNGTGEKDAEVKPVLAAYKLTLEGPESQWQLGKAEGAGEDKHVHGPTHRESVPIVVHGRFVFTPDLRTVDLETGRVIDQAEGITPQNGGFMQVIENLVLVRRDGTHGAIGCGWYKISPEGKIRVLNTEEWRPPFGSGTTSYHHPIYYPSLAGRLFLRQQDGIYCWDLRQ